MDDSRKQTKLTVWDLCESGRFGRAGRERAERDGNGCSERGGNGCSERDGNGYSEELGLEILNEGADTQREITLPFCCDLLSFAMSRAPYGCAWVTVMGNVNTLAVAALADAACVILAEGASLDEAALQKAKEQGITVFRTEGPIFETALRIHRLIRGEAA